MIDYSLLFGVLSAVANVVIAVIASRGRWWEKADKVDEFMEEMKKESGLLLKELSHVTTNLNDMKSEYKEFTRMYSQEMRELQSRTFSHEHRITEIERRLNTAK